MFNTWILSKYAVILRAIGLELYSWWSSGGALLERVKTTTVPTCKKSTPHSIQNHTALTLIVSNRCCHDRSISEPAAIKIIWLEIIAGGPVNGLPFASASELRKFIPLNFVLIIIITIISVQIFLSFVNILKGTSNVHFPQVNMILYGLAYLQSLFIKGFQNPAENISFFTLCYSNLPVSGSVCFSLTYAFILLSCECGITVGNLQLL